MNTISQLQELNPLIKIQDVRAKSFTKYGRLLHNKGFSELFEYLAQTSIPQQGNQYIAHDEHLLNSLHNVAFINRLFGYMPIQYGYVNGNNSMVNALEYHKSIEINLAVTDMVLALGLKDHLQDNLFHTSLLEFFYIPAGTVIELKPETLHFSPIRTEASGFKCGVILPYSTNMHDVEDHEELSKEDVTLFKTNKWLIAHKDFKRFIDMGAYPGLIGTNFEINI